MEQKLPPSYQPYFGEENKSFDDALQPPPWDKLSWQEELQITGEGQLKSIEDGAPKNKSRTHDN